MTDPIADMLTRIRNAQTVRKKYVIIPLSNIKLEIAKILKKEGFIEDFSSVKKGSASKKSFFSLYGSKIPKDNNFPQIKVELKYHQKEPAISNIKRISKPGRRVYVRKEEISNVLQGLGISILSTSSGVMTDKQARKKKIGGEVLCEVW